MNIIDISKALSNQTRLNVLEWLKNPEQHFPPHTELGHFNFGVCVLFIQEKAGLSQSTISHYLTSMQKADLLIATRVGKWTYYKRNENIIKQYVEFLSNQL